MHEIPKLAKNRSWTNPKMPKLARELHMDYTRSTAGRTAWAGVWTVPVPVCHAWARVHRLCVDHVKRCKNCLVRVKHGLWTVRNVTVVWTMLCTLDHGPGTWAAHLWACGPRAMDWVFLQVFWYLSFGFWAELRRFLNIMFFLLIYSIVYTHMIITLTLLFSLAS